MPDFKINLAFLSRETLQTIRKKATKTTFKNRQPVKNSMTTFFLSFM
jgi:hypothetical protein